MDLIYDCCAGLDVHKRTVMVCVNRYDRGAGKVRKEVREFGTMTEDILALGDWLREQGVRHLAMESTGVYWKPIYNLLEDAFEVLLVNAQHIKKVPGRKTDTKDCEWIAELLQHGLLRGSFVPPRPMRELRDLTRHRVQAVGDKTRVVNRLQQVLEDANIKLGSVASDVVGVSGRSMIEAIIAGEEDPEELAELARRRLRGKNPQLKHALRGRVTAHHRFLLETLYEQLKSLEATIERLTRRISAVMAQETRSTEEKESGVLPFDRAATLLTTVPGIGRVAAETILAETGTRMAQFPSAAHLASWAGISAGNNESAGKRKSGKTPKGNRWLRRILVQVAQAAGRSKNTYLSAQYRRIAARRGRKRAAVAVAHTILVIVYHMLRTAAPYHDLGPNFFDQLDPQRLTRYLVKRLEALGNKVTVEPLEPAA